MSSMCQNRASGKVRDFCVGFLGVTGLVIATALLALGSRVIVGAVSLGLAGFVLCLVSRRRHVALGMLCALLIPALIVGAACVPVSMSYNQRPDSPGSRIYSPPAVPAPTNQVPQPNIGPVPEAAQTNQASP
jgi:hypothetical protein